MAVVTRENISPSIYYSIGTCDDCGATHSIQVQLEDYIWEQIAKFDEILCADCIDTRLVNKGLTSKAKLYYKGKALQSITQARIER